MSLTKCIRELGAKWAIQNLLSVILLLSSALGLQGEGRPETNSYFGIRMVDEQTGRGVPLVQLTTVNHIQLHSDSGGWIAFHEPGLMDREVFFSVWSHGYEFPKDGFGNRGFRTQTKPGLRKEFKIKRINVAERLYRTTGQGIYRDSLLLGERVPIKEPVFNARVTGQDSIMPAIYQGQIHWFWGDTLRESYPLGNFKTSGAVSELPGKGGLPPAVGINLKYFTDKEGFSRGMVDVPGEGIVWLDAVFVAKDENERPRMLAHFSRRKDLTTQLEHGLVIWNSEENKFTLLARFDLVAKVFPAGQTLETNGYVYFCTPYPWTRVPASLAAITNLSAYEVWSPYASEEDKQANRESEWGWKRSGVITKPKLEAKGSSHLVTPHAGSVRWNAWRKRYLMLFAELGGTSHLGETWIAEAERLEGPWSKAQKIVSHERYSFYNPCHHAFFDEEEGRVIYFEGTYTADFSGNTARTPRYEYNQVMYRLDLSDRRLQ